MAKNVKKLNNPEILPTLVTTREGLVKILDENRLAHERFVEAQKQLNKTDKSIITFLLESGQKTVQVLGYLLNLLSEAVKPKKVVIGVFELQDGLTARGYLKERDLIEDIVEELKEEKEKANIAEAEGQFTYDLEVIEVAKRATG